MIKFDRAAAPIELCAVTVSALVAEYKSSGKAVWKQKYIETSLLAMSQDKCAYCEALIDEESKYMEIDHFYCKSKYPDKVVDWSNLLPSCKRCNGSKLDHDVLIDGMIVDPTLYNPKDYIYFDSYFLRGKNKIGDDTIRELNLNELRRMVLKRAKIGSAVIIALDRIKENIDRYNLGGINKRPLNDAVRSLRSLFIEASPESEYSAVTATVMATQDKYSSIKNELIKLGRWNEFIPLEIKMFEIALTK